MRVRLYLTGSLACNVLLLAAVVESARFHPPIEAPQTRVKIITRRAVRQPQPAPVTNALAAVESPRPFHWSDIESEDYKTYMENLREIECPEATLRDIIVAEVNDVFVHRRQALFHPLQSKFWDELAKGNIDTLQGGSPTEPGAGDWKKALEAMKEEKQELLTLLLGRISKLGEEEAEMEEATSALDSRLASTAFLPAAMQAQVKELRQQFERRRQEIRDKAKGGRTETAVQDEFKAINRQEEETLKQLLGPTAWGEYELRNSQHAQWAQNIYGMDLAEDEIHAIAKLRAEAERQPPAGYPPPDGPARERKNKAAAAALDSKLEDVLGSDRVMELHRAEDPQFNVLSRVAARYELPADVPSAAYELNKAAMEAVSRLRSNNDMSEDDRDVALEAMAVEYQKAVSGILGVNGFKTLKHEGDRFLQGLTQTGQ